MTNLRFVLRLKIPNKVGPILITLGKNYKSNNIPQLIIGDTIVSDNLLIAEAFNDFFVSIRPKLSAEIEHDATDLSESESLVTSLETLFTLSEISEYNVFLLLSNLKSSKSTGIDSIPARVLKSQLK